MIGALRFAPVIHTGPWIYVSYCPGARETHGSVVRIWIARAPVIHTDPWRV